MRAEATTTSVQDTSQPQVKKRQYLASQGDFSAMDTFKNNILVNSSCQLANQLPERISTGGLPESDWPVVMSMVHFHNC